MFNIQNEINDTLKLANSVISNTYSNYKCPTIVNIKYTKATSYWARIKIRGDGMYELIVSNIFESIPDENVARLRFQSSMIHELIHTIPGCWDHRRKFQTICRMINYKYPEYNLQTSTDTESLGLVIEEKTPRYIVVCKHCKHEYKYYKKPRYNLDNYVCGHCGHSNFDMIQNFS